MRRQGLVLPSLVVLLLLAVPGVASADYAHVGTFSGPGSEPGQIDTPGRAAVEQATGNLFVVDSDNDRVQVFAPNETGTADYLTSFGAGELSAPWGIAIAEAGGQTSVYVADAGNGRIVKYDSDEAGTPSFTIDAAFTSPAAGAGAGEVGSFKAALAIDPTGGDLLLADNANKLIQRFDADGTFVSAFDGSNGAAAFSGPIDLAVNSTGDVYVIDANGDIANAQGTSKALRYSAAGEYKAELAPVGERERAATVAVDPDTGEVAVSGNQDNVYELGPPPFVPVLQLFDSANQPLPSPTLGGDAQYDTVSGLAFAGSDRRLYVVMDYGYWMGSPFGNPHIQAFERPVIGPPTAVTQEAVSVGTTTAWLRGSVNPNGFATTYYFEYGNDAGYGSKMPIAAINGSGMTLVSRKALGLSPATTYHYRLVAENEAGVVTGEDVTFTTDAAPAPSRVYEMVSPPEKNGASISPTDPAGSGGAVSGDGNAAWFMSPNALPGSVSSGFKNWYASFRGASNWATKPINLPFRAEPTGGGDGPITVAIAEDMSKALVFTNTDPITGELRPRRDLYLHDLVSGAATRLTPDAVTGPQSYIPSRTETTEVVRAVTRDLSHVLIAPLTTATLTPDAEASTPEQPALYVVDTTTSEIEFVTTAPLVFYVAGGTNHHGENVISEDGRVAYIDKGPEGLHRYDLDSGEDALVNAAEGTASPPGEAQFLEASSDGRIVFFSSSEQLIPSDLNGGADVYRYDAEAPAGGRLTLVTVDSEPADGSGDNGAIGSMGASRSGDRLYFRTGDQQLVEGAPVGGGQKLYLWDGGTLKYVGTDPAPSLGADDYASGRSDRGNVTTMDQFGDYLVFASGPALALPQSGLSPCPLAGGYRCSQVYLYDATASTPAEAELRCVSCLPAPHRTPWSAGLLQYDGTSPRNPRGQRISVSDDGTVVFATTNPLLPEDLNGAGRDFDNSVIPNISSQGQDVYAYRDGELELISSGKSPKGSYPLGISRDGKTIGFITVDRLSGWDVDSNFDAYVSRIGGGLPEPPAPPASCAGDSCLPPATAPPYSLPGSSQLSGPADARQRGKKCPKGKRKVKGKCVKKRASGKRKGAKNRNGFEQREGRR